MLQGQVASVSCFRSIPSCYLSRAERPKDAMSSPVSCVHPVAYWKSIGARLCLASCFFLLFTGKRHLLMSRLDFFDCTVMPKRIGVRSR
jgi:hypothetical protein